MTNPHYYCARGKPRGINLTNQEKHISDGIGFLKNVRSEYNIIFLKECLHHFSAEDKLTLLKLCYERANTTIIVARPHDNQYPWFKKAQESFKNNSVKIASLTNMLIALHFSFTKDELIIPIKIPATQWLKMIKNRFWSNLSYVSDLELLNGLNEILFDDKFVLIIATHNPQFGGCQDVK